MTSGAPPAAQSRARGTPASAPAAAAAAVQRQIRPRPPAPSNSKGQGRRVRRFIGKIRQAAPMVQRAGLPRPEDFVKAPQSMRASAARQSPSIALRGDARSACRAMGLDAGLHLHRLDDGDDLDRLAILGLPQGQRARRPGVTVASRQRRRVTGGRGAPPAGRPPAEFAGRPSSAACRRFPPRRAASAQKAAGLTRAWGHRMARVRVSAKSVSIQRVWTRKFAVGAREIVLFQHRPVKGDDRGHAFDTGIRAGRARRRRLGAVAPVTISSHHQIKAAGTTEPAATPLSTRTPAPRARQKVDRPGVGRETPAGSSALMRNSME